MDTLQVFYANLYSVLLGSCPFDYANTTHPHMKELIEFHDYQDYIQVIIRAEDERGYDYSTDVNEGLNALREKRNRSAKEEKNYHWVNRALEQAGRLTGEKVSWEGGFNL